MSPPGKSHSQRRLDKFRGSGRCHSNSRTRAETCVFCPREWLYHCIQSPLCFSSLNSKTEQLTNLSELQSMLVGNSYLRFVFNLQICGSESGLPRPLKFASVLTCLVLHALSLRVMNWLQSRACSQLATFNLWQLQSGSPGFQLHLRFALTWDPSRSLQRCYGVQDTKKKKQTQFKL